MNVAPMKSRLRKQLQIKHPGSLPETQTREYIVKGIIEPGTLCVIYGEPGCGKSFLALHISYLLSLGKPVFGRRVKQSDVLYIGLEGEVGFERRVTAARQRWFPSWNFYFVTETVDLFAGLGDIEAVMEAIREVRARVVIIDTFARAMGAGSENEPADMGAMIQTFDVVRRETGATVCVVHHCGKDKNRGMRGHSSLLAAADTVIEVERSKAGDRSFRIEKSKDGVDGETFSFELNIVPLGEDSDGDMITSCVVKEGEQVAKGRARAALTELQRGWLNDLQAIFAEPDLGKMTIPVSGMTQQFCLTRDEVREGLKRKGRLTLHADGTLTGADREKIRAALNSLKDKGKIGMTDKYVWILKERQ